MEQPPPLIPQHPPMSIHDVCALVGVLLMLLLVMTEMIRAWTRYPINRVAPAERWNRDYH